MTTDNKQEKISGRTYVKDERIIWDSDEGPLTQIPIKDIKVIGEYTTSQGPFEDDWFLVFALDTSEIRQISVYATGAKEMLEQVGQRINTELTTQLANSADWKSNVLWPTSFRGQELFTLTKTQPTGIWAKLKSKISSTYNMEMELADSLKKFLS